MRFQRLVFRGSARQRSHLPIKPRLAKSPSAISLLLLLEDFNGNPFVHKKSHQISDSGFNGQQQHSHLNFEKGFSNSRTTRKGQQNQQDRSVLLDITNDSPIVGLATGSLETPLSAVVKNRSSFEKKNRSSLATGD